MQSDWHKFLTVPILNVIHQNFPSGFHMDSLVQNYSIASMNWSYYSIALNHQYHPC